MIKKSPPPPRGFLFAHPAHFIACGCGSGLAPVASGTFGTLFAWFTYPFLRLAYPTDVGFALFLAVAFVLGVWCCQIAGRNLGVVDHGAIVWDEIVPFWFVLLLTPFHPVWQLAAFFWFRFYDVVKPAPASYFDTRVKNGFGVMMDDVVAAGYTVLTLAVFKALIERLF